MPVQWRQSNIFYDYKVLAHHSKDPNGDFFSDSHMSIIWRRFVLLNDIKRYLIIFSTVFQQVVLACSLEIIPFTIKGRIMRITMGTAVSKAWWKQIKTHRYQCKSDHFWCKLISTYRPYWITTLLLWKSQNAASPVCFLWHKHAHTPTCSQTPSCRAVI